MPDDRYHDQAAFPTSTTVRAAVSVETLDSPESGIAAALGTALESHGNIVQSASITLWVTNKSAGTYQLYELLRSWTEGSATWNESAAGALGSGRSTADWGRSCRRRFGTRRNADDRPLTINLNADGIALCRNGSTHRRLTMCHDSELCDDDRRHFRL
jgi:hypothetical protein